jgi:hypothetical protein
MGKGNGAPATLPQSAFYIDNRLSNTSENSAANGQLLPNHAEKAEHLAITVSNLPDMELMEPVPRDRQIALEFPNISAWVPDLFGPGSAGGESNTVTRTLRKLGKGRSTQPNDGRPNQRQVSHEPLNIYSFLWQHEYGPC